MYGWIWHITVITLVNINFNLGYPSQHIQFSPEKGVMDQKNGKEVEASLSVRRRREYRHITSFKCVSAGSIQASGILVKCESQLTWRGRRLKNPGNRTKGPEREREAAAAESPECTRQFIAFWRAYKTARLAPPARQFRVRAEIAAQIISVEVWRGYEGDTKFVAFPNEVYALCINILGC